MSGNWRTAMLRNIYRYQKHYNSFVCYHSLESVCIQITQNKCSSQLQKLIIVDLCQLASISSNINDPLWPTRNEQMVVDGCVESFKWGPTLPPVMCCAVLPASVEWMERKAGRQAVGSQASLTHYSKRACVCERQQLPRNEMRDRSWVSALHVILYYCCFCSTRPPLRVMYSPGHKHTSCRV